MAANISHMVLGLGVGYAFLDRQTPKRFLALSGLCAALPDVDVISLRFGLYEDPLWGHRGIAHSLFFALLTAGIVVGLFFRGGRWPGKRRLWLFGYFFALTASHDLIDLLNEGVHGVALFAPFYMGRFFSPWRPLLAAPLFPWDYFSMWGVRVIAGEVLLIWLPTVVLVVVARWRRGRARDRLALDEDSG